MCVRPAIFRLSLSSVGMARRSPNKNPKPSADSDSGMCLRTRSANQSRTPTATSPGTGRSTLPIFARYMLAEKAPNPAVNFPWTWTMSLRLVGRLSAVTTHSCPANFSPLIRKSLNRNTVCPFLSMSGSSKTRP